MKVIRAPRPLLLSAAAVFALVPLAVITAGVFSREAWWNLSLAPLQITGGVVLLVVAPISWRLVMGRRGAWEGLAILCALACLYLAGRSILMQGTIQGLWTVLVTAFCYALLAWIRTEQRQPYFDPRLTWYQGLPTAIPGVEAVITSGEGSSNRLRICRLNERGLFAFSKSGAIIPETTVTVQLVRSGEAGAGLNQRIPRIDGVVVRQFEGRTTGARQGDWGVGIRFHRPAPDLAKEFRDFLEVLRGEGCIS